MTEELKQLQKQEALKRLEILQSKYGLPEYVVTEFSENGTKYYSEYDCYKMQWTIHKISEDNFFETAVKDFEMKNNVLVYYSIFEPPTHDGIELWMLYVSEDKWNWKNETKDILADGDSLAYCKNFDYDEKSGYWYYKIEYVSFK